MARCDNPAPHPPHVLDCDGVPALSPPVVPKLPPAKAETLHVMQASMQYSDTAEQKRADVTGILRHFARPDLVGLTETTRQSGLLALFEHRAPLAGYTFLPGPGGAGILVEKSHGILATGFDHVLDAYPGDPRTGKGAHGPRGILWATVRTSAGNVVTFLEFHNVTRAYLANERRTSKSVDLLAAAVARTTIGSAGRGISVLAADLNVDEDTDLGGDPRKPAAVFGAAGITTVYDELRTYPDTHGGKTLDVIATVDRDSRVEATRVKVWPGGHSDHKRVSAWLSIKATPKP